MSADGRWRASTPAREHRCTVVDAAGDPGRREAAPPVPVGGPRRLQHLPRGARSRPAGPDAPRPRPATTVARRARSRAPHRSSSTTAALPIGMPSLRTERGAGQGGLVALMAVAFAAIVVARLSGGGPDLTPAAGRCRRRGVAVGRREPRRHRRPPASAGASDAPAPHARPDRGRPVRAAAGGIAGAAPTAAAGRRRPTRSAAATRWAGSPASSARPWRSCRSSTASTIRACCGSARSCELP